MRDARAGDAGSPGQRLTRQASPLLLPLVRLRERLDALREGRVGAPSMRDRLASMLPSPDGVGSLTTLDALSAALDQVGLHTLEDAKLLRRVAPTKGRAAAVARGLEQRTLAACVEFERAVQRAERALRMGRPLPGAATTLEHHWGRLHRAARVADAFRTPLPTGPLGKGSAQARSDAGGARDPAEKGPALEGEGELPSRSAGDPVGGAPFGGGGEAGGEGVGGALPQLGGREDRPPPPRRARLAIAEFLEARARAELHDLAQRRRDLEAAHELLLRTAADVDRERTLQLRWKVAQARQGERELPLRRDVPSLLAEVRGLSRTDPRSAWRELHALHQRAVEAGREDVAAAGRAALETFLANPGALRARLEADALLPSPPPQGSAGAQAGALAELAFGTSPEQARLLDLAAGCSRFFDVETVLAEEVEVEMEGADTRSSAPRQVPWPTQRLDFDTTGSPERVHDFVIEDPRRVLHDLASHRQRVRVYLEDAPDPAPRQVRRSSVRVYVCDASGSMHGARARFRDAILLAELNALRTQAQRGAAVDPLYFCYFNDRPSTLTVVEDADDAARHMARLFRHTPAGGQTDISLALVSAFDSIRQARGRDPLLARATVVLVTDGEDELELELLRRVREPLGELPVALSLISLGEENADLRALAEEQQARGERAFYVHLSDAELLWARSAFETPHRTLLPRDLEVGPVDLEALEPRLRALEAVARGGPGPHLAPAPGSFEALLPEHPPTTEGEVAPDAAQLARVLDILRALEETAPLVAVERRAGECVVLLAHLRAVYALDVATWMAGLAAGGEAVHASLRRLRLLARPVR